MTALRVLLVATAGLASTAGIAAAQQAVPDTGGRVYGLVGGGFGDGTFATTGAGAGLRLNSHLGLDLELSHLSGRTIDGTTTSWFDDVFSTLPTSTAFDLGSDNDAPWFPSIRVETHGRDVTTFLTKLTVEFPVADGLLFPYLTGGGGLGRVMERYSIVVDTSPWIVLDTLESTDYAADADDGSFHFFSEAAIFPRAATPELGLALVLGGGVDVRLWRGFAVGVDIRWLRVLRAQDALDTAQATARASYRF